MLQDLSRAGKRLMGFCRTNLFKRLESSGQVFLQSLERHILRNYVFLHAMENGLPLPIGTQDAGLLDSRRTMTRTRTSAMPMRRCSTTTARRKATSADIATCSAAHRGGFQRRARPRSTTSMPPQLQVAASSGCALTCSSRRWQSDLAADARALARRAAALRCSDWDPARMPS